MRNGAILLLTFGLIASGCAADGDDALPTTTTFTTPTTTLAATTPSAPTATSPVPDVAVLAAGDHEFVLSVDGDERRYLVYVPEDIGADPVHVVMALHGGGGSAPQLQGQIELDVIADREGFIAVYPDGVGIGNLHTWNAGDFCCGLAARTDVDDVGFLTMVLEDLETRTPVDGVVVAGHSNGAMMSFRFAAERPGLVDVLVPVAAVGAPETVPDQPIPLMQIHSVDDPRALYEGGEGPPFPGTNNTVVHFPAMFSLSAWAVANGCGNFAADGEVVESDEGHTSTRVEWQECAVPTVHLRLTGAGHGWPGATAAFEGVVGPNTDVISASEELWAFAKEVLANRPVDDGSI